MKHINRFLLTAALGSSLLALESCRKWDTNRLEGRWELQREGLPFTFGTQTTQIIFDFEKDGDFTEEITDTYIGGGGIPTTRRLHGDWKWTGDKKMEIDIDFGNGYIQELRFESTYIHENKLQLVDRNDYEWEFKKL